MNRSCAASSPSLGRECFLKHLSLFWHGSLHAVAEFFYSLIRETKVSTRWHFTNDSPTSGGEICSGGQRKHGEHTLCPRLAFTGSGAESQAAFPPQSTEHGYCGGPTRLCSRRTCRPTHTRDRVLLHDYPGKSRNCTRTDSAPCTV